MSDWANEFLTRRILGDLPLARQRMAVRLAGLGVSPLVSDAMNAVPRHAFVPASLWRIAYAETGLWLANGAALPAPEATARILSALEPFTTAWVLEIGTGTGYLAALLGRLYTSVLTVDRVDLTDGVLTSAQLPGVQQMIDANRTTGAAGAEWRAEAPFDTVLVGAALPSLPLNLFCKGGRLVAVVGPPWGPHRLLMARTDATAETRVTDLGPMAAPIQTGAVINLLPAAMPLEGTRALEGPNL